MANGRRALHDAAILAGIQDDSFSDAFKATEAEKSQKLQALLKRQAINENISAANKQAQGMGMKPGKYAVNATEGGFSVNPESAVSLSALLTPAQEAAEKTAGKQIADWDAAGGRPAMEKNLNSLGEVQKDLAGGQRDAWDRGVGTLFGTSPSLLGLFGSKEKERRDKARNTALTIAKQTDPNPTEKQIEAIMGQIYDPSSSNEDNLSRIDRFSTEQQKKAAQMEQASRNYKASGYATLGNTNPAPQADGQDPEMEEYLRLKAKHGRK